MVPRSTAYALLIVNMALWGGALVVARGAHELVPPLAMTFWRWFFTAMALLPLVWHKLPREISLIRESKSRGRLLMLCIYMSAGTTLSVVAVNYTTAINATLINGTQPTLTALVAFVLAREGLSLRQGLGVLAAFLGIVVMVSQASLGALMRMDISVGDPVMLVAVVSWALYAVELHRTPDLPGNDVLLFVIACAGMAIGLPLYVAEGTLGRSFVPTGGGLAAILYLAVGSTLLAVFFWNLSIRSVGANRAAVFVNLIPVFGAGFAMVFLGERLFSFHLLGAVLVFSGILMAVRRRESDISYPEG